MFPGTRLFNQASENIVLKVYLVMTLPVDVALTSLLPHGFKRPKNSSVQWLHFMCSVEYQSKHYDIIVLCHGDDIHIMV